MVAVHRLVLHLRIRGAVPLLSLYVLCHGQGQFYIFTFTVTLTYVFKVKESNDIDCS
jgi:hypothetical protein